MKLGSPDTVNPENEPVTLTEDGANNNPKLQQAKNFVMALPHSKRPMRIQTTGMFHNPRAVFAYRLDAKGNPTDEVRQMFGAGWQLSQEEVNVRDAILADPANKNLNEEIYRQMGERGLRVDSDPPQANDVRVL